MNKNQLEKLENMHEDGSLYPRVLVNVIKRYKEIIELSVTIWTVEAKYSIGAIYLHHTVKAWRPCTEFHPLPDHTKYT